MEFKNNAFEELTNRGFVFQTTHLEETKKLLTDKCEYDKMSKASNPYGDGHASERIVDAIVERFSHSSK